MTTFFRNPFLQNEMLPVDIVLAPAWWHRHEGISFDEDFFFHPARRVEDERKIEQALFDRWGRYGLGADHSRSLPVVGAVHLAAGFQVSEMLGCEVEYIENSPPVVKPANRDTLDIAPEEAFRTPAYRRLETLIDALKARHGGLVGDVNWSGILNLALDLRGQSFFVDLVDRTDEVAGFLGGIAEVIDRFTRELADASGTTSISVNRNVRNISRPVFLHSECSHVMISVDDYDKYLAGFDAAWSRRYRPFGIHYCGQDPHRYAEAFARLPHLDFLDVGWGGDVAAIRSHLPETFLNIRLSPVEIIHQSPDEIRATVRQLVRASANPYLTGVCCINMDDQVGDDKITAMFEEVESLRAEYSREGG